MFALIFGYFGNLSTEGIPPFLFYLTGLTLWNYFSECLMKTSETFVKNQNLFGKVFFPRLIVPLSIILSSLLKFGIQFILFSLVWIYYYLMAGLSLGFGIIFSSITTKYKDMNFLLAFGIQLLMYASSVVIPISAVGSYAWVFRLNPMVNLIESFRYAFLGAGEFNLFWLGYSFVFMCILLFFGIVVFNKVEKSFMDTV
jgi:lipopolysaccharide transport system permease protein